MAPRILTKSEERALAYQSQGSFPNGSLVLNTYSLYDTLVFAAGVRQYELFGQTSGQSSKYLTNMKGAGQIPGGQSFQAYGISIAADFSTLGTNAADVASGLSTFYANMRPAIVTFARNNEDFSAQFPGSKFLPPISTFTLGIAPATSLDHIGDYSRNSMCYKFVSPIVIGQNTGFSVTFDFETAPIAELIGIKMQVFLDGALVKKQTA